jgi:hypothetical protein
VQLTRGLQCFSSHREKAVSFRHVHPTPFSSDIVVCSHAYTVVHCARVRTLFFRFGKQLERCFSRQSGKEEPCTILTVESMEMIAAKFHSRPIVCHIDYFHSVRY